MSAKTDMLRAVVDAMTPGEWKYDAVHGRIQGPGVNQFPTKDIAEMFVGYHQRNADGICAMRNHAAALLDVVTAAQTYLAADGAQILGDRYYVDRADARAVLRAALTRLEAMP